MNKVGNGETRKLVEYAVGTSFEHLPQEAVKMAKYVFLDTLGVIIGASKFSTGQNITSFVSSLGGVPESTIIGSIRKTDAINAALANGTMAHDLELDDIHLASCTHAAAVLVPALLAVAEKVGCSGKEFINALVLAYDIECRISLALDSTLQYARSFHPTSVCGTFGAAAGAAKILGLDEQRYAYCLGLAGSQACGINAWENEPDHYMKSFQTGVPARNGVTAALLAANGFTAAPAVLDGKFNIFDAFSGAYSFPTLIEELGTRYEIMRTAIKKYPCCRYIHAPLDAMFELMKEENLTASQIKEMVVHISETGAPIINRNELYSHNCQYNMAMAAIYGKVEGIQYSSERRNDSQILDLADRISVVGDKVMEDVYPEVWGGIVEIFTHDGRHLTKRLDYAKGSPENPLDDKEIVDKFTNLSIEVLGEEKVLRICEKCLNLEVVSNMRDLCKLLVP
ncbi:MmgE/PrpD family protein [Desulfallas sp. Bu1-1]|uniref:MmgE/PrpD family protein n=1 Tax=Desulfallas sp. Bu1-1 TaxID=2787620 RepID=UPI00189FB31F|nr:MmgE/PrpD family protein [Desulfallas sp. Bu1-1]MBF7084526.1 MmgE/PrpD family protein [Desulfallas sp. Bu1-1]